MIDPKEIKLYYFGDFPCGLQHKKFRFNNSPFQHSAECQSTAPFLWASRSICIEDYLQIYLCGFSCLKVTV